MSNIDSLGFFDNSGASWADEMDEFDNTNGGDLASFVNDNDLESFDKLDIKHHTSTPVTSTPVTSQHGRVRGRPPPPIYHSNDGFTPVAPRKVSRRSNVVATRDDTSNSSDISQYVASLDKLCDILLPLDARDVGLAIILLMNQTVVKVENGCRLDRELIAFAVQYRLMTFLYGNRILDVKWVHILKYIVSKFGTRIRDGDKHTNRPLSSNRLTLPILNAAKRNNEQSYKSKNNSDELPVAYTSITELDI